jgi:tripartite-type tricarboxylate transporter receptor subunit TctC
MISRIAAGVLALLSALFALPSAIPASAQSFYEGKTITVVTSTGVGGTYDVTARLIARHMPRFIPGKPTMVVQNMPGGGNLLATNFMYSIAPKDGTSIATVHNAMPLHQVLGGQGVRFDAAKFEWLGSTGPENEVILVWHTSGIRTLDDTKKREVILGGTGAGSGLVIIPRLMNTLLGTRFKIVTGYKSSEDINIALQRGEVEARAFSLISITAQRADWLRDKKIIILAQVGGKRAHEIPDVPLVSELAKSEEDRQVFKLVSAAPGLGRAYLAPPGVPADRLAILRKAYEATMKDATFRAEAEKLQLDIDPMGAAEVTQLVRETVNAPASVAARAKAAIEGTGER